MQHQKQAFGILARTNVLKMKWMTDNEGRLAAAWMQLDEAAESHPPTESMTDSSAREAIQGFPHRRKRSALSRAA